MDNVVAINPRAFVTHTVKSKTLKDNAQKEIEFPTDCMVQAFTVTLRGDFTIGANVPEHANIGGLWNILRRLLVVDDGSNDHISLSPIGLETEFRFDDKGTEILGEEIVMTSNTTGKFAVHMRIPLGQEENEFSSYDTGANCYVRDYQLILQTNSYNQDGVIYGSVNDLKLENVKTDVMFETHILPEGHKVFKSPNGVKMPYYMEREQEVENTKKDFELEKLTKEKPLTQITVRCVDIDSTADKNGIMKEANVVSGVDNEIKLSRSGMGSGSLGLYLPDQLKAITKRKNKYKAFDHVLNIPFAHDGRLMQSKTSVTKSELQVKLPVVRNGTTNHLHNLVIIERGFSDQAI